MADKLTALCVLCEWTVGQQRRASDNIRAWLDEAWPTPAWWERGFGPDAAAEDGLA